MAKITVGITIGDPSGVGPEITLKAIKILKKSADFLVIGDPDKKGIIYGHPSAEYGRASMEYLEQALELLRKKEIDCLVTCPISKEAINLAGFPYSGHTEYFAEKLRVKDPVMLLLNQHLRFSLLTRHIPLRQVAEKITAMKLQKNIQLTCQGLKNLFMIKRPRIVVCGLNPHASDNGVIGDEENRIISPAIKKFKTKLKADIYGPLSADVAIKGLQQKSYDCAIAMYHDQALIPLKQFPGNHGVNLTLGLPIIRTSPLHGTAFDIAGKNIACPDSLIAAIKLAVKCCLNQRKA
ncbi:MAG: 4-hydroxythreonine-4-phosphate dehydrogenase PdxA [Candidatus Omnitrophota bacterium]